MRHTKGFTLLELLISIVIFSILIGIAVPSFVDMVQRNSVVAEANELMASITLTRSEAIKREADAVLTRVSATTWRAFVDDNEDDVADATDGNGTMDAGERLLITHTVTNTAITLTANGDMVNGIRYMANGRARSGSLTDDDGATDYFKIERNDAPTRCIRFSLTGRPWVDKDSSEGGGCS